MPAPPHWESQTIRMSFLGEKCPKCGKVVFPPRDICDGVIESNEPEKACGEVIIPPIRQWGLDPKYQKVVEKRASQWSVVKYEGKLPDGVIVFRPGSKERG